MIILQYEKLIQSVEEDDYESLYKVLLRTSLVHGSELTYMNAGVLICIISESGDSIRQRIPSSSHQHLQELEDVATRDVIHFKRSSTDAFIFQGPKLGGIEAVWINIESGRWRLAGANLNVINRSKISVCTSTRYDFETDDILLGEGGDISMIELRPCRVTESSFTDSSESLSNDITSSSFSGKIAKTNEESM